ncbi:hypothetical protein C8F04DRAFT_1108595 [Mycena alexandri]|uniref:Uncharacterized protein n=1 Tax=Mycena alexandri TaxID=1745969 RepID=A0AAD6ST99_9AGAR|nr:hypothetical protein C8F04DRAFT_1108595 [Mycena alexandri]
MDSATTQSQPQADEEDDPSSPEYIILIRDVVKYVRQERKTLVSALDEHTLRLFETFSEDAQKLLVCLSLIRKDLKWHPIRRLLKLGGRLQLDQDSLKEIMSELCQVHPGLIGPCFFAQDQSQMSREETLSCLTVEQLQTITGLKKSKKPDLIASINSVAEFERACAALEECIQIQEHVTRMFRRFILLYYSGVRPVDPDHVRAEGSAPTKIVEGIGKRFGTSRPVMSQLSFIDDYAVLVEFEETLFPNPTEPKKAGTNDNYLLIFEDILALDKRRPHRTETAIFTLDACLALSRPARHVLAGVILGGAKVRDLACAGLFDPVNDTVRVITELCAARVGSEGTLCHNEYQEKCEEVLKRLTVKQLVDLGNEHEIKIKKDKVKGDKQCWIDAFTAALESTQSLHGILMPKVLEQLNGTRNRSVSLNPNLKEIMESCVKEYFRRRVRAPPTIAGSPFRKIRQRFS